jgi:hypothetical protein
MSKSIRSYGKGLLRRRRSCRCRSVRKGSFGESNPGLVLTVGQRLPTDL